MYICVLSNTRMQEDHRFVTARKNSVPKALQIKYNVHRDFLQLFIRRLTQGNDTLGRNMTAQMLHRSYLANQI